VLINSQIARDEPIIRLKNVHKSFGNLEAIKGISLSVSHGEVAVIIGPSGCGKSTALRCVNLLERPTSGEVEVAGRLMAFGSGLPQPKAQAIASFRQSIGMVFQQFHLFPHLTVLQNVTAGPIIVKGMARKPAEALALDLLAKVGLAHKAHAQPRELSGGQAQRVGIARALAMEPSIMLFDEVTSALDPELVDEVLQVLRDLVAEGTTMIVVTHEMAFAKDVGSHVYFMDSGLIVEHGLPREVMEHPSNPRTISFLRRFRNYGGPAAGSPMR
jgi:polar amino acid transport system ATP-binding protein